MSKSDLSTALINAGGGTRRKPGPEPVADAKTKAISRAETQPNREGTKPITVHYPKPVRDQLKILAVEQDTTLHSLIGESFNMLFAKYGKPEIAPSERKQ